MKRLFCLLVSCILALSLGACASEETSVEKLSLSASDADKYIESLGQYKDFTITAQKIEMTDATISKYTDIFYEELAFSKEELKDEDGRILPLTDASVELLGSDAYKTVTEFMLFVKAILPEYLSDKYERDVFEEAVSKAVSSSVFKEIPKGLIISKEDEVTAYYKEFADSYNLKLKKYLNLIGSSMEKECEKAVKRELVLMKIAQVENITVSDGETLEQAVRKYIVSQFN